MSDYFNKSMELTTFDRLVIIYHLLYGFEAIDNV